MGTLKKSIILTFAQFLFIASASIAVAGSLSGTLQTSSQKGIVMGTARVGGTRGIVMGTCRNLQAQPIKRPSVGNDRTGKLLLGLPSGQRMVLPDGVYKAQNGIQIHMHDGRIELVDGVLPR